MKPIRLLLAAVALLVFASHSGLAGGDVDESAFSRTRVVSTGLIDTTGRTTIDGAERIATNRGIVVRLGTGDDSVFVFDTELLRVTGAWTGGSSDFEKRLHDDYFVSYGGLPGFHRSPPPVDAQIYFGTRANTPGWSKGESFTDPRSLAKVLPAAEFGQFKRFAGENQPGQSLVSVPCGPLPRDWAKYRGMYLSGDSVVFAYTVGQAALLESPGLEIVNGCKLITRALNVLTPGDASSLLVADAPAGMMPVLDDGKVAFSEDPAHPDERTWIGVLGAPVGAVLTVDGTRVTFKLPPFAAGQKLKVVYARGPAADHARLAEAIAAAAPPVDLQQFTHGGPPQWPQTVKVKGALGASGGGSSPYVVDSLATPVGNLYHTDVDIAGIDFFKDGRIAIGTASGDVWLGKGLDDQLETIEWKRFAAGLGLVAGLKIVDDQIYVLGRDQITRLHDLNHDGEADFYECFNNDVRVTTNSGGASHLETDSKGNFYFSPNGLLSRVSGSGQTLEVFASGVGVSGGLGIASNDEISVGEATYIPSIPLHEGSTVGDIRYVDEGDSIDLYDLERSPANAVARSRLLCWIPGDWGSRNADQIWVTNDKWGQIKGALLYLSYEQSKILGVLQESAGNVRQGGTFQFPLLYGQGMRCARFNPVDGQLYLAGYPVGSEPWSLDFPDEFTTLPLADQQTLQLRRGKERGIQRIRYTGKPVTLPSALHVTEKGIAIDFTGPYDLSSASNVANYSLEQYNYQWTSNHLFVSGEYKVSDGKQEGHDKLAIKSVFTSPDHRSVFLVMPGLKPAMQTRIHMNLKAVDGSPIPDSIANTVNIIPDGGEPQWFNFAVGNQF